jgi:hypothetical protein
MGTGIIGCIPLSFCFSDEPWGFKSDEQRNKEAFIRHAPKDFFDFYNKKEYEEETGKKTEMVTSYEIKPEILLPNLKDFFFEFYQLIDDVVEEESAAKFNDEYDVIVASGDYDKFCDYFNNRSGGIVPFISPYFDAMYIENRKNLHIYNGSYKAILEEWSSLSHMERLLWAAMKHPLAKVMRFGMSL